MKHLDHRKRAMRVISGLTLLALLAILLTGCWLFNKVPIASFTASTLAGEAPLTVNFSAILSYDSDGIITKYEWDFGDGSSGAGESVSHTYTAAGSFTVVLRVTDNDGATSTAQKTIIVTAPPGEGGGGPGPTASFTATPLTGEAPLTVTFNASASTYAGHAITYYSWDFGDGTTGTGITTTHTYAPATTTTYHVVLRIIASDNTEDTATKDITVIVSTSTPPSTAPTASFTANPTTGTAPADIAFDPGASTASTGRTLTTYVWSFGDGSTQTEVTDTVVNHTFVTSQSSQNFTVTLTVIDDLGGTDSYSRTVTVENRTPIAGFEMSTDGVNWTVDDIELRNCQTAPQTIWFRSLNPNWSNLVDPDDRPNESSKKPTNFETGNYTSGDRNLSYDPEGQWGPGDGWGILHYSWDMGDGFAVVGLAEADDNDVDYTDSGGYDGGSNQDGVAEPWTYVYQLAADEDSRTFEVTLRVMDELGQWSDPLTRKIKLVKAP